MNNMEDKNSGRALELLYESPDGFNKWRHDNQSIVVIDFRTANMETLNAISKKNGFFGVNLYGAIFDGMNLEDFNFSAANLRSAKFCNTRLQGADFSGAELTNAILCDAWLCKAYFGAADLSEANLNKAIATWANFRGAHLEATNMSESDLSRADFTAAASIDTAIFWGSNLYGTKGLPQYIVGNWMVETINSIELRHI